MTAVSQNKGKTLALIGLWLQLGPVFGLVGTVVGMLRAFSTMGVDGSDPKELAAGISTALITTAVGAVVALVGIFLIAISVFAYQYRAKWLFVWLVVLSVLHLFWWPYGTVLGVVALIALMVYRRQFLEPGKPEGESSMP